MKKDLNKIGDSIAEIDKYLEKNHTDIDFEKIKKEVYYTMINIEH